MSYHNKFGKNIKKKIIYDFNKILHQDQNNRVIIYQTF